MTESTSIFEYQLMKEDKVLQISRADFNTEGTYSCFAQNDGGNLTTRLNLRLIGEYKAADTLADSEGVVGQPPSKFLVITYTSYSNTLALRHF